MNKPGYPIALFLLIAVVASLTMTVRADKLKNRSNPASKKWHWVARRHKDDGKDPGNGQSHIAYVIKIAPQTAFPDKLEAALWAYDGVVQPGGGGTEWKYKKADGYPITLPEVNIGESTGDLLKREWGEFKLTKDDKVHDLKIALNQRAVNIKGKAKGKSKGRARERVVMRYTVTSATKKKGKDDEDIDTEEDECPEVYEDEVLEEEDVPTPDDELDYPDP